MHSSALKYGQLFFNNYLAQLDPASLLIVDIGAQDINGSLRPCAPRAAQYIGVDFIAGKGVDVVLTDPYQLPFETSSVDAIVCSSVFEHAEFFWLLFLECIRTLKPTGLLYINVPSNGMVHRYPIDSWRLYPDAGHALVNWAKRHGEQAILLESFIAPKMGAIPGEGMWNDFVAVFLKHESHALLYTQRILDEEAHAHSAYRSDQASVPAQFDSSPDLSLMLAQHSQIAEMNQKMLQIVRDQSIAATRDAEMIALQQTQIADAKTLSLREAHISALNHQIEVLSSNYSESEARIVALTQQQQQYEQNLSLRDQQIIGLDKQLLHGSEAMSVIKDACNVWQEQLDKCDREISTLNLSLHQQTELSTRLTQQLDQAGMTIAILNHTAELLRAQLETSHQETAELSCKLGQQLQKNDDLVQQIQQSDTALGAALHSADLLRAQLESHHEKTAGLELNLDQQLQKNHALVQQIQQNDTALGAVFHNADVFRAQLENHHEKLADLERNLSQQLQRNTELTQVIEKHCDLLATSKRYILASALKLKSLLSTQRNTVRRSMLKIGHAVALYSRRKLIALKQLPGLRASAVEMISRSPLFNATHYLSAYTDVMRAGLCPATHYLLIGWKEHRNPSEFFSTQDYLQRYPDVAQAGINPLLHYIQFGQDEGREIQQAAIPDWQKTHDEAEVIRASGLFDCTYYKAMYPEVRHGAIDPVWHYCAQGWQEGKNPSDTFDTNAYLEANSDIKNGNLNPFWHYVTAGAAEGRHASPHNLRFEDHIEFGDYTTDILVIAFYTVTQSADFLQAHRPNSATPLLHETSAQYSLGDQADWQRQADLSERHGISAWCFSLTSAAQGHLVLSDFLRLADINIRFCLEINLDPLQLDDQAWENLALAINDPRYLTLDGRPVLVMTLPDQLSEGMTALYHFANCMPPEVKQPHPYLIARGRGYIEQLSTATSVLACDAILDMPMASLSSKAPGVQPVFTDAAITMPYGMLATEAINRINSSKRRPCPIYREVSSGRDDIAGNQHRAIRYSGFKLQTYRAWLDAAIADTRQYHDAGKRIVFANAWNDWNHGAVLEPDKLLGFSKLNETSRALFGMPFGQLQPKVSVIVPNFNHAPYLRRRLDSIYGQSYRQIEVWLLDDGSTDESLAILQEYADRYPDITRTLFNSQNSGGVFRQWAKGLKHATGSLIWIAESDDYCDDNFLEVLVRCFDDEAVMLAYSKVEYVGADEVPLPGGFTSFVEELPCHQKWQQSYVNTAHKEVCQALGILNTIPNVSGALLRRPVDMPLLDAESWLSMQVAGDWVFYLHLIRGGKLAFCTETTNYFRRSNTSVVAKKNQQNISWMEWSTALQTVHRLYDVPVELIDQGYQQFIRILTYAQVNSDPATINDWFDRPAIALARQHRCPNILVTTQGFFPGGAEILPLRMANEFKRQGHSVLLLSCGYGETKDAIRRLLRADIPVVITSSFAAMKQVIQDFGIEVLNSHQWHVQQYPLQVPDVFHQLKAHIASLHGMIENTEAFGLCSEHLHIADENVTTWVYTADKNLGPFIEHGIYDQAPAKFIKLPNGIQTPHLQAVSRSAIGVSDDAFVLCCVSRAIPEKGWAEAIEAVTQARQLSGRDIHLVLVGNGEMHEKYYMITLPDYIHLIGFSENSAGYYAAADMGIMLTRFKSESFPLTILDCLFAGKPYISCDVGDIRNMLTQGADIAGAVVPLEDWQVPVAEVADIIQRFATDPQLYSQACELVPLLAARYRIEHVAEQYLEIFQNAVTAGQDSEKQVLND